MGKNSKKQFRRNEKTYRGHQDLDKFLSDKKLERKQIAKDGSCLFRAVAEQVFSSQSCHHKVRMQCVEYIQAHQDDFKEFMTMSMLEYLEHLRNELWGGELELVVLSRLYDRSIIVYNEANGIVHEQVFQTSEEEASSQPNNPIMLAFSGGNHYDSVYSTQHMRNTAFCQGIVYEMLFLRVLKDAMPPPCKQKLNFLQDLDMEQIRVNQESSSYEKQIFLDRPVHLLSTHYKVEEIESMAANLYRNTALDVHQREKANIERRDRHVAASIQFQRGDAIIFKIGGKEMEGEIASLNVSPGCHLVYVHKNQEGWAIPSKDIALKQSHITSGRRSSGGQSRSRNQQQQQFSGQTYSSQRGQYQSVQSSSTSGGSDSSKAVDTPAVTRDAPSSKKPTTQGSKSKEGKRASPARQVGPQPLPSKGVPSSAMPLQSEKNTTVATTTQPLPPMSSSPGGIPPSRTLTSNQKKPTAVSVTSSTTSPPGTNVEPSTAGQQRRVAPSMSRNIQTTQVRSGHVVSPTSHSVAKVTRRTDTGSLDSDDPSSTSEDESSPQSEHSRRRSSRPHSRGGTNTTTADSLPAYYDEDDWSIGEHEAESRAPRQKQQSHVGKEKRPVHVVEGKLHIGRGGLGYSDRMSGRQQQVRAAQKHASERSVKSGGVATEVKVATSRSVDASKLGSRQSGANPPARKGPDTRTSPAAKQLQQQQRQSAQQSQVVMQVPAPTIPVQQQSPIQGLIDGPNSERDGRESPPYLERQIPRDPSSQPQDAWPLFEEDPANTHPATTTSFPPVVVPALMESMATSRQQQLQHQRSPPPPSSPPTGSVPPAASTDTTTPHTVNPTLLTGIIPPLLPPLAHRVHPPHVQPVAPTPPQSPLPDQFQGGGGGGGATTGRQPIPLSAMFPLPTCSSPSTTAPPPIPPGPVFHSFMQQRHFIPPMSTAAAMQQFFSAAGGIPPPHPGMLYNQTHGHSNIGAPPPELASGKNGGGGVGDVDASTSVMGMPPLISPLQPLSTKRSSPPHGERTVAAAMSPLTVTAYTQTRRPKLTDTHSQTDVKTFRDQAIQFHSRGKKVWTQTDGCFVAITELSPPKPKNDSKVAIEDSAIEYAIQCLNVYLQYVDSDETPSELLQSLENLKEQRLQEQSVPCQNELMALNASQQGFLESLARGKSPSFPINAHPVGDGHTGVSIYETKALFMKEPTPPRVEEDATLQQAVASLPVLVKHPQGVPPDPSVTSSSSSTSDLHPLLPPEDDKSNDANIDVTPQQEVKPPIAAPPFPIHPHMMMPSQRPGPYMMPMPMLLGHGFYTPSFPGMPGIPGMPGMMMPPFGPHMIPPGPQMQMSQYRQQAPPHSPLPATGHQEQSLESLEDTSSVSAATPIPVSTSSVNLENSSTIPIDHLGMPIVNAPQAVHVCAVQEEEAVPVDARDASLPSVNPNVGVENREEERFMLPSAAATLERQGQAQQEDDREQFETTAFIPSIATTPCVADAVDHQFNEQAGRYQMQQGEETSPSIVDSDVNISKPGLPCRGISVTTKEKEIVSATAVDNKEGSNQKVDTKQQKPSKSSHSKQQSSQENTSSSKQQGKANSTTFPKPQQNYQRSGATGYNSSKSTTYSTKRFNNYSGQRQQQYNSIPSRRSYYPPNNGKPYARHAQGGNGANSGRYQQRWRNSSYQGGQQQSGGSFYPSPASLPDQGAGRPHNPSGGSKPHTSSSVTPVAASNMSSSTEDHNRNVPQYNSGCSGANFVSSGTAGKFTPKNFTSFPSSPHNHPSSVNIETAMSSDMIVPQTATDSAPRTASKEEEKKQRRWHFKETSSDRKILEVPDPNLLNWGSSNRSNDHLFGYRQPGDYADTLEDPFPTMSVVRDDKEFAFKATIDDFDAQELEVVFPALKSNVSNHRDTSGIHHPPAQCTGRGDARGHMLATGGGYFPVHN